MIAYEFNEFGLTNILHDVEVALLNKKWEDGLLKYTQYNLNCTLEDEGYHVVRTPNTSEGVWGGLVFDNQNNRFNLQKTHTYLLLVDVKGVSHNASVFEWSNNVGYVGGGLKPGPTELITTHIPTDFNGEMTLLYKFTINDDIYKVCTSSYSSFTQGQTYLSYKGLKIGWIYTDSGDVGTDVYFTNFRMYDVTGIDDKLLVNKNGTIKAIDYTEDDDDTSIIKSCSLKTNEIIEM